MHFWNIPFSAGNDEKNEKPSIDFNSVPHGEILRWLSKNGYIKDEYPNKVIKELSYQSYGYFEYLFFLCYNITVDRTIVYYITVYRHKRNGEKR